MSTLLERFWDKVEMIPFHSCWEWTGATNQDGYGIIGTGEGGKTSFRVHRMSYALHVGPIPEGKVVCHSCDNPGCVRPEHLFIGTMKDNNADRCAKGRTKGLFQPGTLSPGSVKNLAKTHCPHGHAYAGDNLAIYQGRRHCKTCALERARRHRADQ